MLYVFVRGLEQDNTCWQSVIDHLDPELNYIIVDPFALNAKSFRFEDLFSAFEKEINKLIDPDKRLMLCGHGLGCLFIMYYAIDHAIEIYESYLFYPQVNISPLSRFLTQWKHRLLPQSYFQSLGFNKKDIVQLYDSIANHDFVFLYPYFPASLFLYGDKNKLIERMFRRLREKKSFAIARMTSIPGTLRFITEENGPLIAQTMNQFYIDVNKPGRRLLPFR